jgi:7-cyano-7-deazaguanine synthase
MDSTTLAYQLKDEGESCHTLSFYYGQRHKRELEFAHQTSQKLWGPFSHLTVDFSSLQGLLTSVLTDERKAVPEGHYAEANMVQTVVPNRNMIMLAAAGGYAYSRGIEDVFAAMHAGDHAIYPDCRPGFFIALNKALWEASDRVLQVHVPFIHMTKADIARKGVELGVPWHETYSCYKGGLSHCGRCGTCVERLEALELAGVQDDQTQYEDREYWKTVTKV